MVSVITYKTEYVVARDEVAVVDATARVNKKSVRRRIGVLREER